MMIPLRARSLLPLVLVSVTECASPRATSSAASTFTIARPEGKRDYVFTSRQTTPAGTSSVRVFFTLVTSATRYETALVTAYERAAGDAPYAPARIEPACGSRLASPPGVLVALPITPPPHRLRDLVPDCVPEDLFGAASDILPLLMIQMQPKFRGGELRAVGDRFRFDGYETGWRLPPAVLDARIVADSGVVSLDSLTTSRATIGWDTSPMRVDIVRQLAPGQRALLSGQEWFRAEVVVDPRTGELLHARTMVDSLPLGLLIPYPDTSVPPVNAAHSPKGTPVVVVRSLELRQAAPQRP